jgi:hypothetical protein
MNMNIIRMSGYDQSHVHEVLGSTDFAGPEDRNHNHRFATVTGEAIPVGNGRHVHDYWSNTDTVEEHHHIIKGRTGPDIRLPNGNHIHYEKSETTLNEGHRHDFEFASLIGPSPVGDRD